jgi:hypothetical protein
MVASAILLDRRTTLGTLLCVCRDPVRSLRVILTLLQPLLHQAARARLMVRECAAKAEPVLTIAHDRWDDAVEIPLLHTTLHSILAVRRRTPLKIFLVVHVGTHEKFVIAIGQVSRHEQIERPGIDDGVAAISRALDPRSLALFLDLLLQVLSIAVDTEPVLAFHCKRLQSRTVIATDVAHEVVLCLDTRWSRTHVLAQTGFAEHLLLVIHVLFDQAFLVPAKVS